MAEYVIILEKGPNNWSAYAPDLPGCVATGKTRALALKRMREAVVFHIEGLLAAGEPVPRPTITADMVKIPA